MERAAEGPPGGAREARHPRQALAELAHRRGGAARARGARAGGAPDGRRRHRAGGRGAGRDRARRRRGPPRHRTRADHRDAAARERHPPAHRPRGAEERGPAAAELDRHGLERGAARARSRCERSAGAHGSAAARARAGAAGRGANPGAARSAGGDRGARAARRAAGAAATRRRAQEEEGPQGHQEVRHARHHGAGLHARGQAAAEAARAAGERAEEDRDHRPARVEAGDPHLGGDHGRRPGARHGRQGRRRPQEAPRHGDDGYHQPGARSRQRGAKVTDLVVLVVAADDGVMPQTVEAINHARAAEVPIVVAINKIDKRDANAERVKQELGNHGLAPEEWGGDTIMVPVSAKTKEGIAQLLDMILLQADVLELKASPGRLAKGTIVEARLDRGRGPVATVLVQEGTLRPGDAFVCGTQYGRVRAMMSDKGQRIEEAGPSTPVEILGLGGVPEAGDTFVAVQDDQKARQVAEHRRTKQREAEMAKTAKVSLDDLYQQIQTGEMKELKVVLKADVQGSVEATSDALRRLSTDDVRLNVLHGSVGGITESDVLLASASNAVVIGFNVRPEPKAAALAEREGVDIRLYTIIYEALNDVRDALEGLLEPTLQEKVLGRAEVPQAFTVSGIGQVAGCFVTDGKILRGAKARLLRDHVVVHDGRIASLKRFKEDVREVAGGYECGMSFEGYQDVKAGDVIEAYEVEQVARRLAPAAAKGAQAAERTA